mmetsp:Transcript_14506/g.33772  ORF Transcript_14506/g.33772 Transcript_14506/m.33772 type:complete len:86 (+) Transcript_14506:52-309(+)
MKFLNSKSVFLHYFHILSADSSVETEPPFEDKLESVLSVTPEELFCRSVIKSTRPTSAPTNPPVAVNTREFFARMRVVDDTARKQ